MYQDLAGKIDIILDGGACDIGVESTVVDGLCSPPVVLRPGGVSIDALRTCPGWEDVRIGYKDNAEMNGGVVPPRAPGMKYKHYSPRARVVLVRGELKKGDVNRFVAITTGGSVGVIGTRKWISDDGRDSLFGFKGASIAQEDEIPRTNSHDGYHNLQHSRIPIVQSHLLPSYSTISNPESYPATTTTTTTAQKIYSINIGPSVPAIAHNLFSALRELDLLGVDVIFVESLDDSGEGGEDWGEGAAVMNRLRKAAEFELR